MPYILCSTGVK